LKIWLLLGSLFLCRLIHAQINGVFEINDDFFTRKELEICFYKDGQIVLKKTIIYEGGQFSAKATELDSLISFFNADSLIGKTYFNSLGYSMKCMYTCDFFEFRIPLKLFTKLDFLYLRIENQCFTSERKSDFHKDPYSVSFFSHPDPSIVFGKYTLFLPQTYFCDD